MVEKTKNIDFDSLSDEDLLEYLQTDLRRKVFEAIYDRFHKKVFYKCISMVKNEATAKDLTHDIFIKIFTKISQFKGNSKLSLWIHSISVHYCLSYLKKQKRNNLIISSEDDNELRELEDDGLQELEQKQLLELQLNDLQNMIYELKEEERIVLIMKYFDGLSVKEISEILEIGQSAVKMKLKRTRDKLNHMFTVNVQ